MADYYKVDRRKITLREYWNIRPTWKIVIPWIAARFNLSTGMGTCFRMPETVRELEVPETEFSEPARAGLRPLLEECLKLGFHSPRYFSFESLRRDTKTSFISLLHRSGEFSVRLMHTIGTRVSPPVQHRLVVLLSELSDGTYFFTSDDKPKFRTPPGVLVNRLVGAGLPQLVESHEQHLTEMRWRNPAQPVRSIEMLDDIWDRHEKHSTGFGVQRGLYVRMSPEEVAHELQVMTVAQTMAGGSAEHSDVMVELDRLQNKKAGWSGTIWILVVSVLLFMLAGASLWSWDYVLILLLILFIHELGHYVAMRAFHYRNVRMFFIPFFGAAVAGQHFNVPGWKKVVVSLMGPVPGIVLGAIVGSVGLALHIPILTRIAVIALILNGFNLLPLLPLDGGWVLHALLFSRHYLFDAVFRAAAAVGLFVVGILLHTKILMFLAIPMLLSIPASYRMARIASDLRKRGLPPVSEDDHTIPAETARAIVTEVKKTMPKVHTSRMVAEQTLQIFETLNARPPKWAASVGLLIAHLAGIVLAVLVAGFFVIGQRPRLSALISSMTVEPRRPLVAGAISSWRGAQATGIRRATVTLVANFTNRNDAEQSFQGLTNRLPDSARLKRVGESVLLTLPAGNSDQRRQWFAELQRQAETAFVDRSNAPAIFALTCQLPTAQDAKAVEAELTEYLKTDLRRTLIPPWLPDDPRSPEQRRAHRLARQSYLKAQAAETESYSDPRMRALHKQFGAAARERNEARMAELRKQMETLAMGIARERAKELKTGIEGSVNPEVVDLYTAWLASAGSTNLEKSRKIMHELADCMGQLPKVPGTQAMEDRYSLRSGLVLCKGRTLQLNWVSFTQIGEGAPALLDWLAGKGGSDFKYDIVSGTDLGAEEEP